MDLDVTPFDCSKTKKQGITRTYKGVDGHALITAYISTVNCEIREGKQHYQKYTPEFLRETIRMCRKIMDETLLIHLDSGSNATENIGILMEAGCYFIIKRYQCKESKDGFIMP